MRVLRRSRKRLISISLRRCLTIPLRALIRFQILILSAEFFVHAVLFRALRTLAAFKVAVLSVFSVLTRALRTLAAFKAAVLSVFSALTRALRTISALKTAVLSVFSALTRALRTLTAFKAAVHAALRAVPVPVFADVVYGIADAHRFALLTDCHDIVLSAL